MSKSNFSPADMGDIEILNSRIERIRCILVEVIRHIPVELGHVTAKDLLEELDSI